jgi:MFS family permease
MVSLGAAMVVMSTVSFYLITAYTPTFGTAVLHLPVRQSLTVSLCVGLSNLILLPVMGGLSDRTGRRMLLIIATLTAIATGYPAMLWMATHPSFGRLLLVELWFSLMYACYNGAAIVYLTEIMPARIRTSTFGLAYSLAAAIFGGFTPAICTWLIHLSGNRAAPGLWFSCGALLSLCAVLLLGREQRLGNTD